MIPEPECPSPEMERRREAHRRRSEAYRDRKRRRVIVAPVEVEPEMIAGLEHLGLLTVGERDPAEVACAAAQFLVAAGAVARLGDAIFPKPRERDASLFKQDDFDGDE